MQVIDTDVVNLISRNLWSINVPFIGTGTYYSLLNYCYVVVSVLSKEDVCLKMLEDTISPPSLKAIL